jgi:hypothetical protein
MDDDDPSQPHAFRWGLDLKTCLQFLSLSINVGDCIKIECKKIETGRNEEKCKKSQEVQRRVKKN